MFAVDTTSFPGNAADVSALIEVELRKLFDGLGPAPVLMTGVFPKLSKIAIDVSGGVMLSPPPQPAEAVGAVEDGPSVDTFQVIARPVTAQGVAADVELSAGGVVFSHGLSANGKVVISLKSAADGSLRFAITKKQLEAALLTAARAATASAGVEIKFVDLRLQSIGPKTVDVALAITVKKFMTAVVRVAGRLAVDGQMTASATGLTVDGDGMAGSVAAGFIRPKLQQLNGQKFPLMKFSLGDVRLRDITVAATDGLRIDAKFGGPS